MVRWVVGSRTTTSVFKKLGGAISRLMGDGDHLPWLQVPIRCRATLDHIVYRTLTFGRTPCHIAGWSPEALGEWCRPMGTTGHTYIYLSFSLSLTLSLSLFLTHTRLIHQDFLSSSKGHGRAVHDPQPGYPSSRDLCHPPLVLRC